MPAAKKQRIFGSLAGASVSAAVGLYFQMNPTWGKDHPALALTLYGVACLLCLAASTQLSWVQRLLGLQPIIHEGAEEKPIENKIEIGRDNKGRALSAGYIGAYHEAPVAPPAPPERIKSPAVFDVSWKFASLLYDESRGCWIECEPSGRQSQESIVVEFVRRVPPRGSGESANVVAIAIIRFSHSTGIVSIPRAYWLNRRDYEIPFNVGGRESVIIGSVSDSKFISYTNPSVGELAEDNFPSLPYRRLGPGQSVSRSESVRVEISLFNPYANETIEQHEMEIVFAPGRISVRGLK